MDNPRLWCIRAGPAGEADAIFIRYAQIAISCAEIGADAVELAPARSAFKEALSRTNAKPGSIPVSAGQLYRFVHEMRIGDNVVYPRKSDRTLRWGEIVEPYVYETANLPEFAHRRGVRWLRSRSRDCFSPGALYELGSALALFEVRAFADELREHFADPAEAGRNVENDLEGAVLRDVEEATRDYIARKIKSDLKGYALEPFVAGLFRAMGYRAQETRAMRDGGVDVVAHRDELGIEPPIVKIQVKAHEANIGADSVKAFYAMVHDRDVGIFITTGDYTSSATEFARSKSNLKLIDGVGFVDLIQKYYEALDVRFRQQIPLRRVLVPDALQEA